MPQHCPAHISHGACFGTLTKQHSSTTSPPSLATSYASSVRVGSGGPIGTSNSPGLNGTIVPGSTFFSNGQGGQDETRQGADNGIQSDDERPSLRTVATLTAALDRNERGKSHDFCVLMGNTLMSFENVTSFRRGDHPSVSLIHEGLSFAFLQISNMLILNHTCSTFLHSRTFTNELFQ